MKHKILQLTLFIVAVLVLGACSDAFFNEIPSDRITPDEYYMSANDAELSTRASSAILLDYAPRMVCSNELLSDLTVTTQNADLNWQEINNHEINVDNPYIDPAPLYQIIVNSNESLQYIDSITTIDQDMTDIDVHVYKGNLIGIRSWAYFMLVRLYGEAAYIADNMPKLPDGDLPYLSRTDMLDTLVNQLLPYLDIDYTDIPSYSMYNKALIGEIYLEKQDYQNAATYLQLAIEGYENSGDKYKITKSYQKDWWREIFINATQNLDEIMIAVPFSITEQQPNPIESWYRYTDEYIAKPTSYIVKLFEDQENIRGRKPDVFRGLGVSYDTIDGGHLMVKKYDLDETLLNSSDIILYRAADIHLLLAEALNRLGETEIALAILGEGYNEYDGWSRNVGIRGRAYLAAVTMNDIPSGANVTNYVEDLIVQERAMELAFEGKRWFDLMRVARRRGNSYLADRVAAKFSDSNMASKIKEQLKDEKNWYLPFKK